MKLFKRFISGWKSVKLKPNHSLNWRFTEKVIDIIKELLR